jgi:transcription-repair coupling factor (superfamily II helicase)
LLLLSEIKLAAARARVARVEVREGKLMLTRRGDFILVGGKFPRLTFDRIDLNLPEILQWLRQL